MSGNSFLLENSTVSRKSLIFISSFVRSFVCLTKKCVNRLVDGGSFHS